MTGFFPNGEIIGTALTFLICCPCCGVSGKEAATFFIGLVMGVFISAALIVYPVIQFINRAAELSQKNMANLSWINNCSDEIISWDKDMMENLLRNANLNVFVIATAGFIWLIISGLMVSCMCVGVVCSAAGQKLTFKNCNLTEIGSEVSGFFKLAYLKFN